MTENLEQVAVTPEGINVYYWLCRACETVFDSSDPKPVLFLNGSFVDRICEPCIAGKGGYIGKTPPAKPQTNGGGVPRKGGARRGNSNVQSQQRRQNRNDAPWCDACGENKVGQMRNGNFYDVCYTCFNEGGDRQ